MQVWRETLKLGEGGGWGVTVLGEAERAKQAARGKSKRRTKFKGKSTGKGKGKKVEAAVPAKEEESSEEEEEAVEEETEAMVEAGDVEEAGPTGELSLSLAEYKDCADFSLTRFSHHDAPPTRLRHQGWNCRPLQVRRNSLPLSKPRLTRNASAFAISFSMKPINSSSSTLSSKRTRSSPPARTPIFARACSPRRCLLESRRWPSRS